MAQGQTIGFIGVGVMGEAMCRNLAQKSGARILAWDTNPEPLRRLAEFGVQTASGTAELMGAVEGVMLCLPAAPQVREVVLGAGGLLALARPGQFIVDMSTSPPALARELALRLGERGVAFADAPVARTRQAAQDGTLSIMVGADAALLPRLRPLLACMGTEITHCGPVGCGQVVKLINNLILSQTVAVLAGALELGRRAGVDETLLADTLSKGSADSFALRNHGMKSLVPQVYPERAFSVNYMLKDLSYALELADQVGLRLEVAQCVRALLERSQARGDGDRYHPVVRRVIQDA